MTAMEFNQITCGKLIMKRQRKTVMYCGKRCRIIDNDQKCMIKIEFNGAQKWVSRSAIEGKSK